jgi:hypothetical protein
MNTLISKIAQASLKVGALATDKRNVQQNYDYISADKILERAGDALAEAGVVIVPSIVSENTEAIASGNGKSRYDSVVHFGMIISDGESQLEMPWCGRGSDYAVPDKALYKAITSGHKYFLMKLLNIGVGNEDGEHENEPEPARRKTTPSPREMAGHRNDVVFENLDGGPSDEELEVLGMWSSVDTAYQWAVDNGACANVHEARNSFKGVIERKFGGKFTKSNAAAVYLAVLRHWSQKINSEAEQPVLA